MLRVSRFRFAQGVHLFGVRGVLTLGLLRVYGCVGFKMFSVQIRLMLRFVQGCLEIENYLAKGVRYFRDGQGFTSIDFWLGLWPSAAALLTRPGQAEAMLRYQSSLLDVRRGTATQYKRFFFSTF